MRRLAVVAILLVACGILPAHAQTLALEFHQGDTYKYTLHFSATFSVTAAGAPLAENVKVDAKAKEAVTVNAVESDGTADVSLTFSDLTVTTTGKAPDGSTTTTTTTQTNALPPQQLKIAADGRIVSVNGETVSAESPFGVLVGSELVYAVLPDTAVKPGDKWSKSYDQSQPGGQSSVHITSTSTYLRDETFHGVSAAVVDTKSTADFTMSFSGQTPMPGSPAANGPSVPNATMQGTVTSDTRSWIDPGGHRVLKSTSKASLKASISALETGITITGTQTFDLEPA